LYVFYVKLIITEYLEILFKYIKIKKLLKLIINQTNQINN